MPRALLLCVIAAFVYGCGGPPPGKSQETSEASGLTTAEPTQPAPSGGDESPSGLTPISGTLGQNRYLKLAVTEAGFDPAGPAGPPGLRYYTVGLRGFGRTHGNDFLLEFQRFVFAQNDRGCISHPDRSAPWLKNSFGETALFSVAQPTEGHLTFLVPDDTQRIRVLIAPASLESLVVPAGEDFTPAWPTPVQTIEDGSTLRVLVLPSPEPPTSLPPPAAGRELVVLDFVIENLKTTQGIEFTTSQQLRLQLPDGKFVQASPLTQQIGCRLDDGDVVPPGYARRFMVVYDMPAGAARRLQYLGFEVDEVSVDLQ